MGKIRILAVDDEPNILTLLEARLVKAGYSVLKASNGIEAVALAKKELPALIICDICLPDIDGGQVSFLLHEDARTRDIPIIFLTALIKRAEDGDNKEQQLPSDAHFIAKPFDPQELLDTIQKCLEQL